MSSTIKPVKVSSIAITSNSGSDQTYIKGDQIEFVVNFSGQIKTASMDIPSMVFQIGNITRVAYMESTSGSSAKFTYKVQDMDNDANGISVPANAVSGLFYYESSYDKTTNQPMYSTVAMTNAALKDNKKHMVDTILPTVKSVVAKGNVVTVTMSENISSLLPGSSAFSLTDGDQTIQCSKISSKGNVVTLTTATGIPYGDKVSLNYDSSLSTSNSVLADLAGNGLLNFSNLDVTNQTVKVAKKTVNLASYKSGAIVDAGTGSYAYTLDLDKIQGTGVGRIINFGSDDSLVITHAKSSYCNGGESRGTNVDFTAFGYYYSGLQISLVGTNPTGKTITSISEFNQLSVGDITVTV